MDAAAWGNGVCAGDADGDGRLDLYVTNLGPNFLFRNKGDGTLRGHCAARRPVSRPAAGAPAARSSMPTATAISTCTSSRYVSATDDGLAAGTTHAAMAQRSGDHGGPGGAARREPISSSRIVGGGRFREAAAAHGLADAARAYGFGVVATDVDDDGAIDLFVANDSNPNFLYRNLGNGRSKAPGC